ncbi:MAG: class II aldolase/adducin family protein [Candidatus Eremiobacteraeota bacterium]|nr:class II aldolase/adducin family protein [Candidatus Eremiobacteraeota bacterium]
MAKIREEMLKALRFCYQEGLVWGQSGILTARARGSQFLVAPRGASYEDPTEHSIGVYDSTKKRWRGPGLPPADLTIHGEIYRTRGQIQAIFQSQAPFTTLVACSDIALETALTPLTMASLGTVIDIPYNLPGSEELISSINVKSINSDVLLLRSYGALVAGKTLKEVIEKTITLEFTCRLCVFAGQGGIKLRPLSPDMVESLKDLRRKGAFAI